MIRTNIQLASGNIFPTIVQLHIRVNWEYWNADSWSLEAALELSWSRIRIEKQCTLQLAMTRLTLPLWFRLLRESGHRAAPSWPLAPSWIWKRQRSVGWFEKYQPYAERGPVLEKLSCWLSLSYGPQPLLWTCSRICWRGETLEAQRPQRLAPLLMHSPRTKIWIKSDLLVSTTGGRKIRTPGLSHAKRTLYHWATSPGAYLNHT